MLEWLVMLFRLEMLSEEFCLFICSSGETRGASEGEWRERKTVLEKRRGASEGGEEEKTWSGEEREWSKGLYWKNVRPLVGSIPLGGMSGLLRATWIISCASVFFVFRISMVSFRSVSSESYKETGPVHYNCLLPLGLQNSGNFPQIPRFSRNPGWKIPGSRKSENPLTKISGKTWEFCGSYRNFAILLWCWERTPYCISSVLMYPIEQLTAVLHGGTDSGVPMVSQTWRIVLSGWWKQDLSTM